MKHNSQHNSSKEGRKLEAEIVEWKAREKSHLPGFLIQRQRERRKNGTCHRPTAAQQRIAREKAARERQRERLHERDREAGKQRARSAREKEAAEPERLEKHNATARPREKEAARDRERKKPNPNVWKFKGGTGSQRPDPRTRRRARLREEVATGRDSREQRRSGEEPRRLGAPWRRQQATGTGTGSAAAKLLDKQFFQHRQNLNLLSTMVNHDFHELVVFQAEICPLIAVATKGWRDGGSDWPRWCRTAGGWTDFEGGDTV